MAERLAPGTYDVVVDGSWCGKINNERQTPYIDIRFIEEETGNYCYARQFLSEKAWPHTEKALKILGWDPAERDYRFSEIDQVHDDDGAVVDPSALNGAEATIVVEEDSYEADGETRVTTKVKWINQRGGAPRRRELPAGERADFLKGLRKQVMSQGAAAPKRERAKPPANDRSERLRQAAADGANRQRGGDEYDFDDIPF